MKRKILALLCFLGLNLSLNSALGFGSAFANENEPKLDPTPFITDYLEKLRTNCNLGVKDFELMRSALSENPPHLTNPLPENKALLSSKCYPYWQNFERIVEKAKNVNIDHKQIITKIDQLIYEIKDNEYQRDEAQHKTENINIEMDFAPIPKGIYKNELINNFTISDDIDIQTTPITQYQWAKVMGDMLCDNYLCRLATITVAG